MYMNLWNIESIWSALICSILSLFTFHNLVHSHCWLYAKLSQQFQLFSFWYFGCTSVMAHCKGAYCIHVPFSHIFLSILAKPIQLNSIGNLFFNFCLHWKLYALKKREQNCRFFFFFILLPHLHRARNPSFSSHWHSLFFPFVRLIISVNGLCVLCHEWW